MTKQLPFVMFFSFLFLVLVTGMAQPTGKIRKTDLRKDILVRTDSGNMVLRLNDSTPMHRDNFIRLVKSDYYKGIGFHRVISGFMIRAGDDVNPQKNSSGMQFYIVQGKLFGDVSLDSVETHRLKGRKLPEAHRKTYKTAGGAPHLDQNYTIFGELIIGYDVLDKIANTKTSGRKGGDKPLTDIRIREMKMVRRTR
jgi:peptidyl-prolyl cis-trans isomerase B (cyclophilin B)